MIPPAHQTQSHHNRQSKFAGKKLFAMVAIPLIVLGLVAAYLLFMQGPSGIMGNQYQAVFLTNGQVYFGKITNYGRDTVSMKDIYYLQQSVNV